MFKPGDCVRNPNDGRVDVVKSVPGMAEYDLQDYSFASEGIKLKTFGWQSAKNWELAGKPTDRRYDDSWMSGTKPGGNGVISVGHDDDGQCAAVVHLPCGRYFCTKDYHADVACVPVLKVGDRVPANNTTNQSKEKTMANALTLVKANIDPETRYARANDIEEINGTLTNEGDNVVTQWMYNKNKTQIIADLKAAEKAVNVARKADEAELEAD